MKKYIVKNKKGVVISYIYFFTDYKGNLNQKKKQFIEELARNVKKASGDYAGFHKKNEIERVLTKFIFFRDKNNKKYSFEKFSQPKAQRLKIFCIIQKCLIKCRRLLPTACPLKIFIFPCFSNFVKKQQEGLSGFVPCQNVIYIFFHPSATYFRKRLKYTLAHEFYHAISDRHCKRWNKSIIGSLVSEGLANNFRISAVGGELTPGLTVLSRSQCRKVWPEVKKILNSKNPKLFEELFFGSKRYPLWSGYALGYQIVRSFLKRNSKMRWKDIVKLSPKEVLSRSDFNF